MLRVNYTYIVCKFYTAYNPLQHTLLVVINCYEVTTVYSPQVRMLQRFSRISKGSAPY